MDKSSWKGNSNEQSFILCLRPFFATGPCWAPTGPGSPSGELSVPILAALCRSAGFCALFLFILAHVLIVLEIPPTPDDLKLHINSPLLSRQDPLQI